MRLIDAEEVIKAVDKHTFDTKDGLCLDDDISIILEDVPTIEERKAGKWIDKHHAYSDEEKVIEEWQSCKCSVCGRYDTRPYMYYFNEPHFCSWCGADMRERREE